MLLCCLIGNFRLQFTSRVPVLILVLISIFLLSYIVRDAISAQILLGVLIPTLIVYMLPAERQCDLLKSIADWYGIMMLISLVLFFAVQVVSLPSFGIFKVPGMSDIYEPYVNYIFYIQDTSNNFVFKRFNGPFIVPGHQAMISCFLLFANRMDFKRVPWLWAILAAVLTSLSLAGYILVLVALALLKLRNFSTTMMISAVVAMAYLFVTQLWNEGQNPVNEMVLSRLEYDKNTGIKGNNRTLRTTDKYFTRCVEDGTIWLGVENAKNKGNKISGAGYKIYLLNNGLLMFLLMIGFYILLINPKSNKRYAISFIVFVLLCFLQRGYLSWYSWLLSYTVGIGATRMINPYKKMQRIEREEAEIEETKDNNEIA